MTDKEKFIRFKNRLLGPTFLNDGTHFAKILGEYDFQFWSHLEEKAPYLPLTMPLSAIAKGQIILERIEIEPSPRRMADLLQALYETFAYYSITPKGNYDDTWLQFVRWLQGHLDSSGFNDIRVKWISDPETQYTPEPFVERYYIPGELKIEYIGNRWSEAESNKILENGFLSRVLKEARDNSKNQKPEIPKKWWEKSWIQILGLIATILTIASFIT